MKLLPNYLKSFVLGAIASCFLAISLVGCGGSSSTETSPPVPPSIDSFRASPQRIPPGSPSTLTAHFSGGKGTIQPLGKAIISGVPLVVTPDVTTEFTLSVQNGTGESVTKQIMLTVDPREFLPLYFDFLQAMKKQGYSFMDFKTYWELKDQVLPEKLLILRHDVHSFDLEATSAVYHVEQAVIGSGKSTFYVLLDMPPESLAPGYSSLRERYLGIIHWLKDRNQDVQPHISPVDMYGYHVFPWWLASNEAELKTQFEANYSFVRGSKGVNIEVKGADVFGLFNINDFLIRSLADYNKSWFDLTGSVVLSYAAHGTSTAMNRVMGNARLLNQDRLLQSDLYLFDTYNSQVGRRLKYLSDSGPDVPWRVNPDLIVPGRYQVLIHPGHWISK